MNVIICGVVKDCGKYLENNIRNVFQLGNLFNKCKIVIYENNSSDNTRQILHKYNRFITTISENVEYTKEKSKIWAYTAVTGSNHPCRIEMICNARNRLMDELAKPEYNEYDIIVMIDFDSLGFNIQGIRDSVEIVQKNPKSVIYANSPKYYDFFALRSEHSQFSVFGPEVLGEVFQGHIKQMKHKQIIHPNKLNPVYSAFGGIGVFNRSAIVEEGVRYDCIVNEDVKNVYRLLFKKYEKLYEKYRSVVEKDCPHYRGGIKDEETAVIWKNNSGYDAPVICEHVVFNFSLILKGYQPYINPRMTYLQSGHR